jgi:hypothetical protein
MSPLLGRLLCGSQRYFAFDTHESQIVLPNLGKGTDKKGQWGVGCSDLNISGLGRAQGFKGF